MGRGARSVTRPIFNWPIVRDFAIRSQLVWALRAPRDTCRPRSSQSNLPKLWHETCSSAMPISDSPHSKRESVPSRRTGSIENMRSARVGDYSVFRRCAKDREKGKPQVQSIAVPSHSFGANSPRAMNSVITMLCRGQVYRHDAYARLDCAWLRRFRRLSRVR